MNISADFKKAAKESGVTGNLVELDEFQAHRFLEVRGETKTVKDLRDELKEIDLDSNNKMCLLEYLMFKYKKTLEQLFAEQKVSPALLAKLDKAIADYLQVLQDRADKAAKIVALESQVQAGGAGAGRAKMELFRLKDQDSAESAKDEHAAMMAKMAAKRALKNPDEEIKRAYAEEQQKVKDEAERKAQEEADKRAASRAALKARMGAFGK